LFPRRRREDLSKIRRQLSASPRSDHAHEIASKVLHANAIDTWRTTVTIPFVSSMPPYRPRRTRGRVAATG
jgi:hypothetical protein